MFNFFEIDSDRHNVFDAYHFVLNCFVSIFRSFSIYFVLFLSSSLVLFLFWFVCFCAKICQFCTFHRFDSNEYSHQNPNILRHFYLTRAKNFVAVHYYFGNMIFLTVIPPNPSVVYRALRSRSQMAQHSETDFHWGSIIISNTYIFFFYSMLTHTQAAQPYVRRVYNEYTLFGGYTLADVTG